MQNPLKDTGQKKTLDKKDGRRMSFQKPKGTIEYTVESRDSLNSIALKFDTTPNELVQLNKLFSRAVVTGQVLYVPDPEYVSSVESSPSLSPISPLSPTSSEAEFDKTTGTVSGVLLVTPNNIMFDPHKTDPLVQENGCEEYGIMCPMEEVMSAAMYKEILDSKIKESLPIERDQLSGRDFCHSKKITRSNTDEIDSRIRDAGNDSASTAPRSTEESLSEDVFTESELSPIREELISSDEQRQDKSSGASSESVQTIHQSGVECLTVISEATPDHLKSDSGLAANEVGTLSLKTDLNNLEMATKEGDQATDNFQEISGPKEQSTSIKGGADQDFLLKESSLHQEEGEKESMPCGEAAEFKQKLIVNKGKQGKEQNQDSETEVEELRKLWKTHTMQQTKQQRENIQQVSQKEIKHKIGTADIEVSALCGGCWLLDSRARSQGGQLKNMRSPWSNTGPLVGQVGVPEILGLLPAHWWGKPGHGTSAGSLITTREDVNSKQVAPVKADLESESFRPNLSDPSELLLPDQIEKVFGALASEPFKVSDGFYGTGETFVFTFCPEFEDQT
ncbi:oxidation resistance protein 1 isoform 1 [Camelus ferus]|nr:oxidation resistance protein 1 isoform 1 [Camelus ferus]